MSDLSLEYQLVLKKNEMKKFALPNHKFSGLLLSSFSVTCDQKALDIRLTGKDTIVAYGEAVLYYCNEFTLDDKLIQVMEADKIYMSVKNLCVAKDVNSVSVTMTFNYNKNKHDNIIFNNTYTNLTSEGLHNMLCDISGAGKYVNKIIWTSPNKLTSFELVPQFKSTPECIKTITVTANDSNQIVMNLLDPEYDADLVGQLVHYNLVIPTTIDKLGIIVCGYIN